MLKNDNSPFLKCFHICPLERPEIKKKVFKFAPNNAKKCKYLIQKEFKILERKPIKQVHPMQNKISHVQIKPKLVKYNNNNNKHKKNEMKIFFDKLRRVKICTKNTQYNVIRRVAQICLMKDVPESERWDVFWTDLSASVSRCKQMKCYQVINHFPGMYHICRKDSLIINFRRLASLFPKDYDFLPKSFILPAEYLQLMSDSKHFPKRTYICKPKTSSKGTGIYLLQNISLMKHFSPLVCQEYLKNPLLIDGCKFDLRIYVLLTCCSPLRVYVYNEGLARFSTSRYKKPTEENISNLFIHLTNYSINKHSKKFSMDSHKRTLSAVMTKLKNSGIDTDILWREIDELIIKTFFSIEHFLTYYFNLSFQLERNVYPCFEILGFDILIDSNLKPYLLEVNHSPSLNRLTKVDKILKNNLIQDTFTLLNLSKNHQYSKLVKFGNSTGVYSSYSDLELSPAGKRKNKIEFLKMKFKWESSHSGNYRKIEILKNDYLKKLHESIRKQLNSSNIQIQLNPEDDDEQL